MYLVFDFFHLCQYWIIKEHSRWALAMPPILNLVGLAREVDQFLRQGLLVCTNVPSVKVGISPLNCDLSAMMTNIDDTEETSSFCCKWTESVLNSDTEHMNTMHVQELFPPAQKVYVRNFLGSLRHLSVPQQCGSKPDEYRKNTRRSHRQHAVSNIETVSHLFSIICQYRRRRFNAYWSGSTTEKVLGKSCCRVSQFF
jgi:hypothetical protein